MIQKDQTDNHLKTHETSTSDHQNATAKSTFKPASSSSATTSSSSWSRFKDPRIVRVSRALGGKDRHSKVCTVRGLRDRRVRLSVPTAIQLYDLQERLGLNQPSKVVDWLLNAAKHEIDELPPLQIPQGFFTSDNVHNINLLNFQSDKRGLRIGASASADSGSDFFRGKIKDDEVMSHDRDERNWASAQDDTRQFHLENNDNSNQLALLSNNITSTSAIIPSYNSFVRFDPSNLTLSHEPPRINQQQEDWQSFGLLPVQATIPFVHHYHHHQPSTQSYFPSRIGELDFQRSQLSNSSLSSNVDSASQRAEQMHFNMTVNLLPSQDHNNVDGSN